MGKRKFLYAFQLLILFSSISTEAGQVIILDNNILLEKIGRKADMLIDTSNHLTFEDILTPYYQSHFVPGNLNLGSSSSVLWCRIYLKNTTDLRWFLRISNAYLDTVQLFMKHGADYKLKETGLNYPFRKREIKTANFVFPLELPKDSVITCYLRVKHHLLFVPLEVGQIKPIIGAESKYNFWFGMFFGSILIILVANFIMSFSIRDKSLIYYILYMGGFGLYAFTSKGYFVQLIPESMIWIMKYAALTVYPAGLFVPFFAISFLKARERSLTFYRICIGLIIYAFTTMAIYIVGLKELSYILIVAFAILISLIMIGYGTYFYLKGFKPARFFIVAYLLSIVSFVYMALFAFDLIPLSIMTQHGLQIANIWEIIFFTVAIGDKTNILRKEKVKAINNALKAYRANQQLLNDQNIILENKVKERTIKLEAAQEQLIEIARQNENEKMRRSISQDIHDDISSGLNKISWLSETLKIKAIKNDRPELTPTLDKIIKASHETVDHLIEIIWELNPNNDDLENQLIYMRNYASHFFEDTSFNLSFDFPELTHKIDVTPEFKRNVFLIMKEALNNAAKYSNARNIRIAFQYSEPGFKMTISDDGIGIEDGIVKGTGNGMNNMIKRAEIINADLRVVSANGKGTKIILEGKI